MGADPELAGDARGPVAPGLGIDDAQLEAGTGPTRRLAGLLVGGVEVGQGHVGADLGDAVGREVPERSEEPARPVGGRDRARHAHGEDAAAQGGEVPRPRLLRVGQRLHVRVEAVEQGAALAVHQVERRVGVEGFGQHLAMAPDQGTERPVDIAEDVEQRQVVDDDVPLGDAKALVAVEHAPEQGMVAHHALGEARRPRGVHDEDGVGGPDGRRSRVQGRLVHVPSAVEHVGPGVGARVAPIALDHEAAHRGRRRAPHAPVVGIPRGGQ